nr:histidine phosphatase family protein [Variovorax dokdonensis]
MRHGPVDGAAGLCYGRSDVAALVQPTQEIAERIAPGLSPDLDLIASPRARCLLLAHALQALRPDLRLRIDPRIAEMDFGTWEGRPWADVPRLDFDAWMNDFGHARAGGSGESTGIFMARVAQAHDDWRASGRPALWVTHAGVMRAVLLLQAGKRHVEQASEWPSQSIGWGDLMAFGGGFPQRGSA